MANYNLTQTGDEVQAYIDSIPVIDVTGTLSGSNIVFATNPYTQIAANYAADCGSMVRLTMGSDVYLIPITEYDGSAYKGQVWNGAHNIVLTISSSDASGVIDVGIDATPTAGSTNLVTSGGAANLGASINVISTADIDLRNCWITSDGRWSNPSRYRHIIIPVEAGIRIEYTAQPSNYSYYAFLTSNTEPVNNENAPLVSGTSRVYVAAGSSVSVIAPEGTRYLYLFGGDGNIGATHVRDNLPTSVNLVKTLDDRLSEAEETEQVLFDTIGEAVINLSALQVLRGSLSSTGTWLNAARYCHVIVPVLEGDTITLTSNASYAAIYGFLTNDTQAVTSDPAPIVPNTSRVEVPISTTITITIPAGCNYLYLYGGDLNSGVSHVRDYLPSLLSRKSAIYSLSNITIECGKRHSGSILSVNDDREWKSKMVAAKKRYYTSTIEDKPNPVVFAHISDLHANWANLFRFVEFCNHHNEYIDDLLNTGDTVLGLFTDGLYPFISSSVIGSILTIVGNHDTRGANGWQQYVGTDVYNVLIAPYVGNWGVTQPTDAAANGYCYYYKDYATQSLRLVAVDIMGYDGTEDSWLASVLADAKTNGYHVVIATHFSGARDAEHQSDRAFNCVECNYSTKQFSYANADGLYGYNPLAYMMTATVKDFIDNGGVFVGYIQGHYHLDFVAKVAEDSRQLIYAVGSDKYGETRDYNHIGATRMQDEFQIISIDTYMHTVRLFKVGANIDQYGRHKNSVCVNYYTGNVIAEGY